MISLISPSPRRAPAMFLMASSAAARILAASSPDGRLGSVAMRSSCQFHRFKSEPGRHLPLRIFRQLGRLMVRQCKMLGEHVGEIRPHVVGRPLFVSKFCREGLLGPGEENLMIRYRHAFRPANGTEEAAERNDVERVANGEP